MSTHFDCSTLEQDLFLINPDYLGASIKHEKWANT